MARGIASANSLKRLVYQVGAFVQSWGGGYQRRNAAAGGKEYPAPYQLAAIQGEAVLRQQFFASFIKRLPYATDAAQQITLWNALVENSGQLEDFINRIGIKAALRREAVLPEHAKDDTRTLYAILCQAVFESGNRDLLIITVDHFMLFQWRQLFPSEAIAQKKRNPTPEELREQLTTQLRKHHKTPVEIRESFVALEESGETTEAAETGVAFKIRYRKTKNEPWETLVALTRPRVSTARSAAFAAAMKALREA